MAAEPPSSSGGNDGRFDVTQWTLILAAGDPASPDHEQAQNLFCQRYWDPVYFFVRGRGYPREDAKDLTQDFFFWLLRKKILARLTRKGGRFRSYLLKVLRNFLSNAWERENARKRRGGKTFLPLDDCAETRYQSELADHRTPEVLFDRQYVLAVQAHVLARLREEYRRKRKQQTFEILQGSLPGASKEFSYAEAAKALDKTEEAVRMAVHRLRRRYGELLREDLATPGTSPEEVDEEIRYLFAVLSGS